MISQVLIVRSLIKTSHGFPDTAWRLDAIKVEPDSIKPLAVGKNCMLQAERRKPWSFPWIQRKNHGKIQRKSWEKMGKLRNNEGL